MGEAVVTGVGNGSSPAVVFLSASCVALLTALPCLVNLRSADKLRLLPLTPTVDFGE
jgi:hypothetical protein